MNNLLRLIAFTAPLFFIAVIIFWTENQKMSRDFETENVRFEKQFQSAWENGTLEKDNWLTKQEKEVDKMWQDQNWKNFDVQFTQGLKNALDELENSTNQTLSLSLPSPSQHSLPHQLSVAPSSDK
ncbi:MAG: hypothetical protein Q9M37_05960 [Desulfonauticus sp.]|nr:hypothetical protein [Desulfonauticus sp.]